MNKRLGAILVLVILCIAGIALAEKKNATVRIKRLEGVPAEVVLNPAELTIETSVPWEKAADSDPSSQDPTLEFSSADGRSMSFQMDFDTFETKENVYDKYISPIENFTLVDSDLKRPPLTLVTWGSNVPSFKGVVSSVSTKYTLFLPDGTPCRATASVKIKSASKVRTKKAN